MLCGKGDPHGPSTLCTFHKPVRTLILQVCIPAAVTWVKRNQTGVSTPQTTSVFGMCLHAKIIKLANILFFFNLPSLNITSWLIFLSSSVLTNGSYTPSPPGPTTTSLTLTLGCQKGTLQ